MTKRNNLPLLYLNNNKRFLRLIQLEQAVIAVTTADRDLQLPQLIEIVEGLTDEEFWEEAFRVANMIKNEQQQASVCEWLQLQKN